MVDRLTRDHPETQILHRSDPSRFLGSDIGAVDHIYLRWFHEAACGGQQNIREPITVDVWAETYAGSRGVHCFFPNDAESVVGAKTLASGRSGNSKGPKNTIA